MSKKNRCKYVTMAFNKSKVIKHLQDLSEDDLDTIMHLDLYTSLFLISIGLDTLWKDSVEVNE